MNLIQFIRHIPVLLQDTRWLQIEKTSAKYGTISVHWYICINFEL